MPLSGKSRRVASLFGTSGTARQEVIAILGIFAECYCGGIRITISIDGWLIVIDVP